MRPIRLGAVAYLNARPLVFGLEMSTRFVLQFDAPSKCAALLHEGSIDVGMVPSIEYLRGGPYRAVPDAAIVSDGAVASVALFTAGPVGAIRTIAADISSRTSSGLLKVLCYESFGIDPEFIPMAPRPDEMLERCDAALVIGDAALFFDYERAGVRKIDLGEQWSALTGLPFVWAFWAGRPGVLNSQDVQALLAARDAGVAASDAVAGAYCAPGDVAAGQRYLKENMKYTWGPRELEGLEAYYALAAKHGVVEEAKSPAFYG